jgi:hypothetical protein
MPLFLNPKLRLALIKLQADKELGPSYAALYALNEGLHVLKYLGEEDYQVFKKRYSQKLVSDAQQKLVPLVNMQEVKESEGMTKQFSMVIDQWQLHPDMVWRQRWAKKAREYENRVPNAKYIIELAAKEDS